MKKIYLTFRQKYTNKGVRYNPSYFLDKMYEDYLKAGLTKLKDTEIPEGRYTAELAPGIKKMTRFAIGEYDENYIDRQGFIDNIMNVGSEFGIYVFNTTTEAIEWLKANTDLKVLNETTDTNGVVISAEFEINPETTDETGNIIHAKTILID